MPPKITRNKKDKWIDRLDNLKNKVNAIYSEIAEHDVPDDDMDFLANMTCNFDEAMAEVGKLEEYQKEK